MTYFHENLKDLALRLVEAKSNVDDEKAERDLIELSNTVSMAQPTKEYIEHARELHEKINREYREIKELCDVASTMSNDQILPSTNNKTELENIKDCLITDEFGILASVLIKHRKIETVKEFIKCVEK